MCLQFVLRATVINITIQRKYYQVTNNLIFSMPTILGIHIKLLKYFQHFQCEITELQVDNWANLQWKCYTTILRNLISLIFLIWNLVIIQFLFYIKFYFGKHLIDTVKITKKTYLFLNDQQSLIFFCGSRPEINTIALSTT